MKSNNYKVKGELKTIADYALILHYCNGYSLKEAQELAMKSEGGPLYEELLGRNIELFKTGQITIK